MTPPSVTVPVRGPGHCEDDAAWAEFVRQYDGQPRSRPDLTDFALANRVFMADRNDLDLIVWQTAAKERIRWLSIELAKAQSAALSAAPAPEGGVKHYGDPCVKCGVGHDDVPPGPCRGDGITISRERANALLGYLKNGRGPAGWPTTLWCEVQAFIANIETALATREEAPAEAGENDDDASTYRPSIASLSDYLWNQDLAADSVESRCILEMWREAVDSNAQTGESAKTLDRLCRVEDWAQAPSALRAQPQAREDAQPVAWRWKTPIRHVGDGTRWGWAFASHPSTPPASINPEPLYTHPAPDALRVAVEALDAVSLLTDKDVSAKGLLGVVELLVEIQTTARKALAALQAEQKGGAS